MKQIVSFAQIHTLFVLTLLQGVALCGLQSMPSVLSLEMVSDTTSLSSLC